MKKLFSMLIFVFILTLLPTMLPAQATDSPALRPILHHFSARNFSTVPVTRAQIDIIIQAGLRAPSAGNRQPWLFTVVQDLNLARRILPEITEGSFLIIVSGVGDGSTNGVVILDCALASQSMFFAAQALGLGARQYTNSALINRTNSLKTELGIPQDHNTIIVTRFGNLPAGVDVMTSASPRANPETRVIYR